MQLTQENKFETRLELSKYLGVDLKTLYVWTKLYQSQGIEALLKSTSGGKHRKVVSNSLKKLLGEKLNDNTSPLQGYTDAVLWVKEELGVQVNYQTLRSFMITNFGCKLKVPRKSHYKKDEVVFEAFKKTSRTTSSNN
ncbi:MAG: transposase [Flavobacteriaceae bacterium]|nr:transposase [Flavobacteriaceae bacterium]